MGGNEIRIGDRVKIIKAPGLLGRSFRDIVGTCGTVVDIVPSSVLGGAPSVLVNHDVSHPFFHDGNRVDGGKPRTPDHHGFWYTGFRDMRRVGVQINFNVDLEEII